MSNAIASAGFCVVLSISSATLGQAPPPSPTAAPTPTPTTAPKLTSEAKVTYPVGATGSVDVVLELVIDRAGRVREASVIDGAEPFAEAARLAALAWQFEPATREGQAVVARIRFAVTFTEPKSTEPADASRPAPSAESSASTPPPSRPSEPITVTVEGRRPDRTTSLSHAEVRQLPGAFGDPFRAIEAMPGVTPIASGLPYFYVRGAPPGNVGYYFDGIRVPLLFHAAAGPSVIHPSFVDEVKLYPGAYPARFGRFAGGIVTADASPSRNEFHGEASVRLIDAGGMLEVPFAEGRGNVAVAGRYSYTAAIVSQLVPDVDIGYWDYQARASYDVTPNDRIGVFAFGALDFAAQDEAGRKKTIYDTRFHRLDVRYDRRLSKTGRLRVAATVGDDRTNGEYDAFTVRDRLRGARLEYGDQLGETIELRAGADVSQEKFGFDLNPNPFAGDVPKLTPHTDLAFGARMDVVWKPEPRVTVVPGVRFDVFRAQGTTTWAPEPRVSARFRVSDDVVLFNDFGVAHQLPSYVVPIPGFQPSLGNGLQVALQSSAGVEAKLPEDVTGSVTVFQNALLNSSDRLSLDRQSDRNPNVDEDRRSLGHTIGAEFLFKRKLARRLGGFVAYTLSRSQRQTDTVAIPAALDRTHVVNVALAYDLGRGWRAGARAVFYTGIPAVVAYVEAARHPPRTTPFYRFDWRVEKRWVVGPTASWSLVFEMLNTTLHKEVSAARCSAYYCKEETIGPISAPSIGVEAVF